MNCETKYNRYNLKSWSLDIEIRLEDLVPVLRELHLLKIGNTKSCTIDSNNDIVKIIITFVKDKKKSIIERNSLKFRLGLTQNDIEFISSYLVKYQKDSLAPVDHIDIEVEDLNDQSQDATLVIKTCNTIAPIPGDEAKKILGLD